MHADVAPYLFDRDITGNEKVNFSQLYNENLTIYQLRYKGNLAGIALFEKHDDIAFIDVAFLPGYRGKIALKFASPVLSTYCKTHKIYYLYAKVRKSNKRSLIFCKWCGFSIYRHDENYFYMSTQHGRFNN